MKKVVEKRKNASLIDAMCKAVLAYPGTLYSERLRFEMSPLTARRLVGGVELPASFMGVTIRPVERIDGIRLVSATPGEPVEVIWIGAMEDEPDV